MSRERLKPEAIINKPHEADALIAKGQKMAPVIRQCAGPTCKLRG